MERHGGGEMSGVAQNNRAKLARMAHQIADFFRSYPQDEASRAVADHINHFWTPRMRADFLAGPTPDDPLLKGAAPLIKPGRTPA